MDRVFQHGTPGTGSMGSNISWRNVHTGLRPGQPPGTLSPIAPFPVPVPFTVPWSVIEPLHNLFYRGTGFSYI